MLAIRNPVFNGLVAPFEDALNALVSPDAETTWSWYSFSPAVDVRETKDDYVIEVDMPGLSEKDITVTLENKHLTLKGERKPMEGATYTRRERAFGPFERVFHLPDDVDSTRVEASAKNGVLILRLPKAEQAKPKTIEIKSQ